MKYKLLFIIFIFLFSSSCSSKKNIIYLQDLDSSKIDLSLYEQYKIQVDDILKIDISSENQELSVIFNQELNKVNNTKESLIYEGYLVDANGNITFPSLGLIQAKNLTIIELRDLLFKKIVESKILTNPNVDIKLLNSSFTILGEVSKPGKYDFINNNLNIFEAIGMAGDLNITGERKNIKLLREINGEMTVINLDLTKSDIFEKVGFQVISGDIIIINPNTTKIKNAGIIGNSGTLVSLLSFVLSSVILITNAN